MYGDEAFFILFRAGFLLAALVAPDLLLLRGKLFSAGYGKFIAYCGVLYLLSLFLSAGGQHFLVSVILIALFSLILSWHLTFAYFGDTMKPDLILIFLKPDHFVDALAAAFDSVRRLLPAGLVVLACAAAAFVAASGTPPSIPSAAEALSAAGAATLLVGLAFRAAFHRNESAVYPNASMPAVIGALHAIALSVGWLIRDRISMTPARKARLVYSFRQLGETPITVAVLMGEGLAPRRMAIVGGAAATTPRLQRRLQEPSSFCVVAKLGFSFGVSSNSSIAGFLSGAPFPERIAGSRSLFQLAKYQRFVTHYFSGQKRSPLDLTAGATEVDRVETRETLAAHYGKHKDWALADLLRTAPPGNRAFFFLYPRVNHAPYCYHQRELIESFFAQPGSLSELVHNYDVGMRAFDHFADEVLGVLETRPGTTFVFVTSDHNELLGEDGIVGHNISGSLDNALVPVLLFTNRPHHPVTAAFATLDRPDAFQVARLVMSAMGVDLTIEPFESDAFFVNNTLPFGRGGFFSVKRGPATTSYTVTQFNREGAIAGRQDIRVTDIKPDAPNYSNVNPTTPTPVSN